MMLRSVTIKNFRGIKDLNISFDDVTVLIGENNSGKTAVLDAIRLCLADLGTRRRVVFDAFDYHLTSSNGDPAQAPPISVQITLGEHAPQEWSDALVARLTRQKILQVDSAERNYVSLRVNCHIDPATGNPDQSWAFVNDAGEALPSVADAALSALQREVGFYYLAALRDAARHFEAKGSFWRPFLKEGQLPPELKSELELALKNINDRVVGAHASFAKACTKLKSMQSVVSVHAAETVSVEAVPGRMFDLLAKAQVHIGTSSGAKIPVGLHGEGTQSLAVLLLFSAFLELSPGRAAIVAIEEPEAHLHPSAVRSIWPIVESIPGQKIVSSHSGDLLSQVPLTAIRRLVKTGAGTTVHCIRKGALDTTELRKLDFHVRHGRGELLFARCWIMVEGESEVLMLTELARQQGIDLERSGIRCVPHRHVGIELFLKVARDLGIAWCALTDNDQQGNADQGHCNQYASAAGRTGLVFPLPESDLELHLCRVGFGAIYESYLSEQTRGRVQAPPNDPEYWPQVLKAIKKGLVKPEAIMSVMNAISSGTAVAPPLLCSVLAKAVELSEGAA